jgi:hypothetical protein
MQLAHDVAVPLLGIDPKEMKTAYYEDGFMPMFILALFTVAKLGSQPRCPSTDEWVRKM